MVNNNASANVTRGTVSNGEMLAILNTAGLKTAKISPLAQIKGHRRRRTPANCSPLG